MTTQDSLANPWGLMGLCILLLGLAGCASAPPATAPASSVPATSAAPVADTSAPARALALAPPGQPPEPALEPIDAAAARAAMHKPRLDPGADAQRSDLWQRVRDGYALPDLDHELVRKWEQYYANRPDYIARMVERGGRYLFHIVEEIERRGMPLELALLPFIESAFDPQAMSRAKASGMWQFMPGTGRDFELRQNLFRDDRRDVLASTRAALDYLQRLHKRFGDWHLALAAYNWGQGNVGRAITTHEKAGLPADYSSLRMPDETRNYVPKLQAMKNLVARPEAYALKLQPLENHPYFLSVTIEHDIDVALAARLSGMSLENFQQLNPQLNKPVILAAGTPQVLLPYDNANRFLRELQRHAGAMASWTAWRAPRTLKPAEAARLVGMPEATLREVNRIPSRMLVTVGSVLLVPRAAHSTANVSEQIADTASLSLKPETRAKKASPKGARGKVVARATKAGQHPVAVSRSATRGAKSAKAPAPGANARGKITKAHSAPVRQAQASATRTR